LLLFYAKLYLFDNSISKYDILFIE